MKRGPPLPNGERRIERDRRKLIRVLDWAVIEGTWALEGLNQKAVQGSMERPHTQIARLMDGGNGGIYYHLWGELEPYRANRAQ